jgi:hypothetical protein
VQHRGQREVERAQAEDREDVRGVDDVGVGRDREDGGHRVHREDEVADLDQHEREEERRGEAREPARLGIGRTKKAWPRISLVTCKWRRRKASRRVRGGPCVRLGHQHLDAGEDEEGREEVEHPLILRRRWCAEADHHARAARSRRGCPRTARGAGRCRGMAKKPKISAMTKMLSIASVFSTTKAVRYCAVASPSICHQMKPEKTGPGDVHGREPEALADADLVVVAVQDAEVEDQERDDERKEDEPHPERLAEEEQEQEFQEDDLPRASGPGGRRGSQPRTSDTRCGPTSRRGRRQRGPARAREIGWRRGASRGRQKISCGGRRSSAMRAACAPLGVVCPGT